ncbi:DUF2778 domain-containing protein [Erwinia sp. S43]|uniref:DUF2778 domain-containing protein n=1 Tax=Erwinia sp. S43 TaxID=2769339 RepID=UPI00190DADA5|nr:DUF2778 domain-containing protein [Erwinia sp. S43]MBK0033913.1 DUF2778 domain-containing protein [Erwinia sp. S43]
MALQGKFILNGADIAPLTIYGVGTFMAFSGQQVYMNKGGCGHMSKLGPIPPGNYYIVDRPTGDWKNRVRAAGIDVYKSIKTLSIINHYEWFALFRADGSIDDTTFIEGVERGGFRLHPGSISEGCITLVHRTDFLRLREIILNTEKFDIPNSKLRAYGKIEVIANGTSCP